jgi:hypothetical protein
MSGQLVAVKMGMGSVLFWESGFFYGFMRGMWQGMIGRMMP